MIRRVPLARTKTLSRGRPLARRTALRRQNRQRIKARRARDFGPQSELCRSFPCVACSAGPTVPHHEPPRSCGGRDSATVPLCDACHRERHDIGLRAFNRKHGVDLLHVAAVMAEHVARGLVAA